MPDEAARMVGEKAHGSKPRYRCQNVVFHRDVNCTGALIIHLGNHGQPLNLIHVLMVCNLGCKIH